MRLEPDDVSRYPARLRVVSDPPILHVTGLLHAGRTVAIVGSRRPQWASLELAFELAFGFAKAGYVVVSGGAYGIDSGAHEGALAAGGATWCVLGYGIAVTPHDNRDLLDRIDRSKPSRRLHPFADPNEPQTKATLSARNKPLVALADLVVVIQAKVKSGSQVAARCAMELGRPLFVPPGGLHDVEFQRSKDLLESGSALPIYSAAHMFQLVGVPWRPEAQRALNDAHCRAFFGHPDAASRDLRTQPNAYVETTSRERRQPLLFPIGQQKRRAEIDPRNPRFTDGLGPNETLIFSCLSAQPKHLEEILVETGLEVGAVRTALLTLSLEDVVVEGPGGFYRRANAG